MLHNWSYNCKTHDFEYVNSVNCTNIFDRVVLSCITQFFEFRIVAHSYNQIEFIVASLNFWLIFEIHMIVISKNLEDVCQIKCSRKVYLYSKNIRDITEN